MYTKTAPVNDSVKEDTVSNSENLCKVITKENAIFTTDAAVLPSFIDLEETQIIRFGTGLEFKLPDERYPRERSPPLLFCRASLVPSSKAQFYLQPEQSLRMSHFPMKMHSGTTISNSRMPW
jgi:hypothetical protein